VRPYAQAVDVARHDLGIGRARGQRRRPATGDSRAVGSEAHGAGRGCVGDGGCDVTLAPTSDGLPELASFVLVSVLPPMATETVNRPEGPGVALMTLIVTPSIGTTVLMRSRAPISCRTCPESRSG
jgi:hypothetical protein